jgi:hypothetical protein
VREPDHWAWAPQAGPQYALVECPAKEVFFGGTRGGGKTDGVLGKWALKERRYGSAFNAIMFRKTTVSAEDAIERSPEIYEPLGGQFNASKLRWRMPNGGRIGFAYLETIKDADVSDIWVEEAGLYETPTRSIACSACCAQGRGGRRRVRSRRWWSGFEVSRSNCPGGGQS